MAYRKKEDYRRHLTGEHTANAAVFSTQKGDYAHASLTERVKQYEIQSAREGSAPGMK